jgi:hypothetical protein
LCSELLAAYPDAPGWSGRARELVRLTSSGG